MIIERMLTNVKDVDTLRVLAVTVDCSEAASSFSSLGIGRETDLSPEGRPMLLEINGHWIMIAPKPDPKVARRVADKMARRECLAEDCTLTMVACGCCRAHYDAAEYVISSQPSEELREKARAKLIRAGLLLDRWQQPRKRSRKSKATIYREAVAS